MDSTLLYLWPGKSKSAPKMKKEKKFYHIKVEKHLNQLQVADLCNNETSEDMNAVLNKLFKMIKRDYFISVIYHSCDLIVDIRHLILAKTTRHHIEQSYNKKALSIKDHADSNNRKENDDILRIMLGKREKNIWKFLFTMSPAQKHHGVKIKRVSEFVFHLL